MDDMCLQVTSLERGTITQRQLDEALGSACLGDSGLMYQGLFFRRRINACRVC